jgi:hypothetical protein
MLQAKNSLLTAYAVHLPAAAIAAPVASDADTRAAHAGRFARAPTTSFDT